MSDAVPEWSFAKLSVQQLLNRPQDEDYCRQIRYIHDCRDQRFNRNDLRRALYHYHHRASDP